MTTETETGLAVIALSQRAARRLRGGHPWIYSNEFAMTPALKALPVGTLVQAEEEGSGRRLGLYYFNPHTLIAARRLAGSHADLPLGPDFFVNRLRQAVALRDKLFDRPFYRLIHAEADDMPGLIIDRFGDTLVLQANTAGMDSLLPVIVEALETVLAPSRIILKNDSPSRTLEGLELEARVVKGAAEGRVTVEENGITYFCDPVGGQKTGWFYDHRDNRAFAARLAKGAKVADFYTYAGGFALACAAGGAASVYAVDRSESSLALATEAAAANGFADRFTTRRADVFAEMERLGRENETFDLVVADPPAFVKNKKSLKSGAQGYRKLARLAASLIRPGGVLVIASCSHHMTAEHFAAEVAQGLTDARRSGRILRSSGAGPDHPVHPALPESAYLKAQVIALD
ncbi:class I SAM-dependent rRNA methyltransferase [Govanella unica]|uniref:Class I SAM-dependent rRNA methyltransferase n=1 Tax=Govanella unica TaxID=2975056 RepID=A0A9X3TYQ1_9PROT|nr:class I SAM-dependent rRNA methyltransferase [Govania unica]MDA5194231.1 class I SAM-dependent rRNA methyltransferase [Govania unica]